MPRGPKPSVRYYPSKGAYCCTIKGTQHILARGPDDAVSGPTYLSALGQFLKLQDLENNKGTDDYRVSALLNQYRIHLHDTRKNDVPLIFDSLAKRFADRFGERRVRDLYPLEVEQWLRAQESWSATTQAHSGRLILGAVAWAARKGLIRTDPLRGRVSLPVPVVRGREACMPAALCDLLLEEARHSTGGRRGAPYRRRENFYRFLWALRLTGARPVEIRMAEAHNYQKGRLVFRWNTTRGYVHKTAQTTQRDRIVYLTPELAEHVDGLVRQHPSGPLFRTSYGRPWLPNNLVEHWRKLKRRAAVAAFLRDHGITPRDLRMYNFRHTFISNWLDVDGDIYTLARVCGTSVKMIEKRYGHPDIDRVHDRYLAVVTRTLSPQGD